jgi:regulator of protease activity HflC (stomatin/prohibitin superfamily)
MNALFSFLGILLLMTAAGFFVSSINPKRRGLMRSLALLTGVAGVIFFALGQTIVVVGPRERMVVFNRVTGNLATPREPGLTIINPITTSYRIYDTARQTYTMSASFSEGQVQGDDAVTARTSDGQEVFLDMTLIYRIDPEKVNLIHVNWPDETYRDNFVRPLLRDVVRDVISTFSVERVYQERATIDVEMEAVLGPILDGEGLELVDVLIRDINFTPEYATAIENAQIAEVEIRQQEFRVRTAEQEAAQREARAQGEANARLIEAEAEAQALQLLADVLAENPQLIEYQYVQNLSDQVQILALPANSPYIFDLGAYQGSLPLPTPAPDSSN